MKVKMLIKQYLLIATSLILIFIFVRELRDNRPIKFEIYTESQEFKDKMSQKFPIGSSVDKALEVLVASAIQELTVTEVTHPMVEASSIDVKQIITCCYYASLLSFSPDAEYMLIFEVDNNRRIISFGAVRRGFFRI